MQSQRRKPVRQPLQVAALGAAVLAATSVAGSAAATTHPGTSDSGSSSAVIVVAAPGHEASLEARAAGLGLKVGRHLGIIHGFAASGSDAALARLKALPDVVSVSPDASMKPLSVVPSLGYDPSDVGSSSSFTQLVGAQAAWAAGYTGAGVDVAVIDTGVSPVADPERHQQGDHRPGPVVRLGRRHHSRPGRLRPRHVHGQPDRRPRRHRHRLGHRLHHLPERQRLQRHHQVRRGRPRRPASSTSRSAPRTAPPTSPR